MSVMFVFEAWAVQIINFESPELPINCLVA